MKNKKKGFTLVELLVVIAILAVLATVSVVGYVGFTAKAKESKALQEAKQVQTVLYGHFVETDTVKDATNQAVYKGGKLSVTAISGSTNLTDEALDDALSTLFKDLVSLDTNENVEFSIDTNGVLEYSSNGYKFSIPLDGNEVTKVAKTA